MRKKGIQIIKYTTLFITLFFFIIFTSILGIWTIFQIRGSISFKPTDNISVTLSGLSLFPKISLQNIHVNLNDYNTDLEFKDIQIKSSLLKPQKLNIYIKECKIDVNTSSPISTKLEMQNKSVDKKGNRNLQSFYTYMPEKLFVESISLSIVDNEKKLSFSGVPLTVDKSQSLITIYSDHTNMEIIYKEKKNILSGKVNVLHKFSQKSQEIKTDIQFLPYILISGKINIDNSLQKLDVEGIHISLDENISNSFSSLFYSVFAVPVNWQKFQVDNLSGTFSYHHTRWTPENISGNISFNSLTIGEKDKPWLQYSSDISIRSQYMGMEQMTEVALYTEKEPAWSVKWKYNHVNQSTCLDFSLNTLDGTIVKNLSPYLYETLMLKQIEPFSIECSLSLQGITRAMEGKFQGKLSLPHIDNIQLKSNLNISSNSEGSTQLKWAGEWNCLSTPIHFVTEYVPSTNWTTHIQTEKLPVKIFQPFTPSLIKNALSDSLADVEINMNANNSDNIALQFKGQLLPEEDKNEYPPIIPSEFNFQGAIQNWEDVVGSFRLSSENSTDFELNPCKLHLFPLSLEGNIKTKVYLSTISSEFLPFSIPGKADFKGELYWDGSGKIQIQGTGSGEGLGMGEYTLPEGVSLCFETNTTTDFYNYLFDIDYLKTGFANCNLITLQKSKILLPSDNHSLSVSSLNISINGSPMDLYTWGISEESNGTFLLNAKNIQYEEGIIHEGEIDWNINIPVLSLPLWQIQIKNLVSQSQTHSLTSPDLPINIKIDEIALKNIKVTKMDASLILKILQSGIELEQMKGKLWNGEFNAKGIIQKKDISLIGNFTGQYNHLDLSQFTKEVQPPWVILTGIGQGDFDVNVDFTTGQLVDGDFNLACPEGLTINRDILLRLILYLQNVSIVQKQLEKLLGKEDPKPFTKGELILGFKDNQATVSLLLTTPNINLAPIFYINADWKTLWSLITTPSGVQIEIK